MDPIPVSGPWITQKEIDYVTDAVSTAWYSQANKYHERFEQAFARYLNVRYAIALPSCTSAIHLALLALGVGPGDEVIVPDCTWIASAAPVSYVGASPVFADIDPVTWCLSPASLEACLTPRTRAVIPVNLYGSMADMEAIRTIAKARGIAVIEDAAESIGSEFRGRLAGSWGDVGVFSFHGSKTLTTGEGGLLATDRTDLRDRILFLRDHGRPPGDRMFGNTEIGWKYKMSSMQAALGLAQLERVEELIARKREVFAWYAEDLCHTEGIVLNAEPEGTLNTYWMVTAILASELGLTKEILLQKLWDQRIDARPFFHPLSSLPAYAGFPEAAAAQRRNTVSYRISPWAVNLPSALNLTRDQVSRVTACLREWIASARRPA